MLLCMGIKGTKQKRRETPASLRNFAAELVEIATTLNATAERMQLAGVKSVEVRYSPGAHAAVRDSIKPFASDAEKKAGRAGA